MTIFACVFAYIGSFATGLRTHLYSNNLVQKVVLVLQKV